MNTLKLIVVALQLPIAIGACYYAFFKQDKTAPHQVEELHSVDETQEGQP